MAETRHLERITALIELALADAESRAETGEVPNAQELNGLRRLAEWSAQQRELAEMRELSGE